MRIRAYRCVVDGCDNYGEFPFPKPWEYFPTFLYWVRAAGNRRILNTTPEKLYKAKKYYYCRVHFKQEDLVPFAYLTRPKRLALPCLKLPQILSMNDLRPLIGKTDMPITGNEEEETTYYIDYNLNPNEFNLQTFDALQILRPKKPKIVPRPPSPVIIDEEYLERRLKNQSMVLKKKCRNSNTLADKLMMSIQNTLEAEEELSADTSLVRPLTEEEILQDFTSAPRPEGLPIDKDEEMSICVSGGEQQPFTLATASRNSQLIKTYSKANPSVEKLPKKRKCETSAKFDKIDLVNSDRFNPYAKVKKVEKICPVKKPDILPVVRNTFPITNNEESIGEDSPIIEISDEDEEEEYYDDDDDEEEEVSASPKVVCRTCLITIKNTDYYKLCQYKHPVTKDRLDDMLNQLYPDMDLRISREPVVCRKCYNCIENFIHFRMNCQLTEQKIKSHQVKLMLSNKLDDRPSFNRSDQIYIDLSEISKDDDSDKSLENETQVEEVQTNPVCLDHCYTNFGDPTKRTSIDKSCQTDSTIVRTLKLKWDFLDELKNLESANKNHQSVLKLNPSRDDLPNEEYFGLTPYEDNSEILSEAKRKLHENNIGFGPYLCEYCAKIYKCLNRYKRHVKKCHIKTDSEINKPTAALCAFCGKVFCSEARHFIHQRVDHDKQTFHCIRCHRKYIWRKKYFALSVQRFERNVCGICEKTFYNSYLYNKHMYNHRRQKSKRPIKSIRRRIKFNNRDIPATKGVLYRTLLNSSSTYKNKPTPNTKGPSLKAPAVKNYSMHCPLCGKPYTDQLEYIDHLKWHNTLPQLRCHFCKRIIVKQKMREGDDQVCEYHCDDCNKLYIVELTQAEQKNEASEQLNDKSGGDK